MAKRRRLLPNLRQKSLLRHFSQAELWHNLSEEQLSKWKHQLLDSAVLSLNLTKLTTLRNGLLNWSNSD